MEQIIKRDNTDRKYFVLTPRLVWAKCENVYQYALWNIVKGIAGDDGECYVGTRMLAELSMMSVGKVVEARKALLEKGLLLGEIRKRFKQNIWHLRIPDLWPENIQWAQAHLTLKERLEYKRRNSSEESTEDGCSQDERGCSQDERGCSRGEPKKIHEVKQKEITPKSAHTLPPEPEIELEETIDLPVVLEYEMNDWNDQYKDCRKCGASFAVQGLNKSRAECPICRYPVRVIKPDGSKLQPSQAARKAEKAAGAPESASGKWAGVSVNAFCHFKKMDVSSVKGKLRHQWAGELREVGEAVGATPEQVATAIGLIAGNKDLEFRTKSIQSPYENGFKRLLTTALLQGVGGVVINEKGQKVIRQPGTYDERPGYYKVIKKSGAIWVKNGEDPPGITMVQPRRREDGKRL